MNILTKMERLKYFLITSKLVLSWVFAIKVHVFYRTGLDKADYNLLVLWGSSQTLLKGNILSNLFVHSIFLADPKFQTKYNYSHEIKRYCRFSCTPIITNNTCVTLSDPGYIKFQQQSWLFPLDWRKSTHSSGVPTGFQEQQVCQGAWKTARNTF